MLSAVKYVRQGHRRVSEVGGEGERSMKSIPGRGDSKRKGLGQASAECVEERVKKRVWPVHREWGDDRGCGCGGTQGADHARL